MIQSTLIVVHVACIVQNYSTWYMEMLNISFSMVACNQCLWLKMSFCLVQFNNLHVYEAVLAQGSSLGILKIMLLLEWLKMHFAFPYHCWNSLQLKNHCLQSLEACYQFFVFRRWKFCTVTFIIQLTFIRIYKYIARTTVVVGT